jgi:predicted Rossmann fold flavoprotein
LSYAAASAGAAREWIANDKPQAAPQRRRELSIDPMSSQLRIAVIGGGAAGFFGAIAAAEAAPDAHVTLYEASAHPLAKVRISGGGRCNVTHACFEPRDLVANYPRGARELLGPLHRFGPRDTVAWFAQRGVELKTESDGRMFPVTDNSATIIDALQTAATRAGVHVRLRCAVRAITRADGGGFAIETSSGDEGARVDRVLIATGGGKTSGGLAIAQTLGHTVTPLAPSLFTFHIGDERLRGLEGLAAPSAELSVPCTKLRARGPVLVTHWGLSGPAVLRLSAWGARELHDAEYRFTLAVNWIAPRTREDVARGFDEMRREHGRKRVTSTHLFDVPSRLWERLAIAAGIAAETVWAALPRASSDALIDQVVESSFVVGGKSMNKEEFVTCGGVSLREVDFRTMESRVCPGLFFAGEVLDIDGITGGFNFQSAWTTGWIAGRAMAGSPAPAGNRMSPIK